MSCMGNGGDLRTKTVDVETLSDVHGGMLICTHLGKLHTLHTTSLR
jgi:hypothetical protein